MEGQKMTSCSALLQGFCTIGSAADLSYLLIPYLSFTTFWKVLYMFTDHH